MPNLVTSYWEPSTKIFNLQVIGRELFSPHQKSQILRNIFSTPKFPDASFLYRDHLGQLYENTVHQAAYHPYAEELNLLKYHQTQLQSYLKKSITDVGCGDGAKDVALLGKHPPQGLTCYLADYSAKMLELADENIREQCPGVHMGNHQLLRDGSAYLTQSLEENTYLRLGGTIGNFSDWEILDFFKQMDNNGILQGNQILFSYFSAPSEEEIPLVESWYRTDTAEQRFMAGAEALGLSRDDFEFEVRYIYDSSHFVVENGIKKYPGQIQNGLRAKRDVDIPLDDWRVLSVKAGAFYPLLISRRFAQEEINQLIQKAGGKVKYRVAGEGEELVMMAKKPRLYKKYQSKIAKSLLAVFLLWAGMGIKSWIDVKVQKDRIKQAEEWFFEGKKGMNEYVDYSLTASTNREAFKNTVTSLYSYLATMYRISSGHEDEVKLLLLQYLGRTKDNSEYIVATDVAMPWSKSTTYTFLQGFVKDNALLLANYGIDTTNPYPQLAEFASNFQTTLDVQENREGYFPMVDGKLFSHQERIYLEGRTLLADKPIARPKVVPYGGYVEDSNALYVRGTLGKYKSSQFGITYWTLVVIDKAGKEYLLATPVVGKMPTSPKFTLEDGQRVIEDYLANFSETDSPKSDKDFDLADN